MSSNRRIQHARTALHLSEKETAARADLTIYELGDIEARADEFASAIPIRSAFRLCSALGISVYEVLGIDPPAMAIHCSPGQYVAMIREAAQLTLDELDQKIGYEAGFIQRVESGSFDLLDYPIELALDIATYTKTSASQVLDVLKRALKN